MNQYHRFFIQKNTELGSPPLVPEIKLHLAVDATELWKMTTKELKDNGLPLPFWACLLYTSPSPRDKRQSRMPSSA